jgi:beta-lactamase superfamily II metal-dependent hydrolase
MPHREVRHRLRRRAISILDTARHGGVRVVVNGASIAVTPTRAARP